LIVVHTAPAAARGQGAQKAAHALGDLGVRDRAPAGPVDERGLAAALGRVLEHEVRQCDVGDLDVGKRAAEDHVGRSLPVVAAGTDFHLLDGREITGVQAITPRD
jgi:hypothetical protein